MSRSRDQRRDDLQDPSWRTRELGPELRRKLFEQLLPSGGPRGSARPEAGTERKQAAPQARAGRPRR